MHTNYRLVDVVPVKIVNSMVAGPERCKSNDNGTGAAGCSWAGKAFLDMLGVFAEFETCLRRERQMEGIAKAKALASIKAAQPP